MPSLRKRRRQSTESSDFQYSPLQRSVKKKAATKQEEEEGQEQANPCSTPLRIVRRPALSHAQKLQEQGKEQTDSVRPVSSDERDAVENATILDDGRFRCGKCDKTLATRTSLVCHAQTVHGEKCFQCNLCHKKFSRKDYVSSHV